MTAIGRAVLNYFGSKVSTAHKYPAPKHDLIIEPFAGGAGYSLCHWDFRNRTTELYGFRYSRSRRGMQHLWL